MVIKDRNFLFDRTRTNARGRISLLPLYVQAAPVSTPFWIDSADAYVHYTLDRTDYLESGRHAYIDTSAEYFGASSITPSVRGVSTVSGQPFWQYDLFIENNKNSDWNYLNAGENERPYLWVEYTYFLPNATTGGISVTHLPSNYVTQNLSLSEYRVEADLSYSSSQGPIFEGAVRRKRWYFGRHLLHQGPTCSRLIPASSREIQAGPGKIICIGRLMTTYTFPRSMRLRYLSRTIPPSPFRVLCC